MTFSLTVSDAVLDEDGLDPATVLAGEPRMFSKVLHEDGTVQRGIWEITPGTVTDVEADEIFTVLTGRATITVEDGPTLEVGPGDVGVFTEGARTTWTVHETLRKVYQITL
ncbi:cupin domain-containing protein [Actinomadura oligospora]|uniref:cupin domain-containing protein n=1 Tax=Actinomadura oligospora TaxID=111804 RepID=UPI00047C1B3A|nr:cupin domain-containing protein [Actinomadura oligospora]